MWRSDQLSYRTLTAPSDARDARPRVSFEKNDTSGTRTAKGEDTDKAPLQKGGVPAAPSGTATLLRLSPNHRPCPDATLAVTRFRHCRLSWLDGRCVQGKARERIHRAVADARLLANPASWSRVAGSSPNWDRVSGFAPCRHVAALCAGHCNTCVAPDVRAVLI